MDAATREQSEFNSAVSYLNRLNTLFAYSDESAISLDVYNWFHTLMAVFRELSTEMKEEEIIKMQGIATKINEKVQAYQSSVNLAGSAPVSAELYMELHSFEMYFRKVMRAAGLQQKVLDSASKALR